MTSTKVEVLPVPGGPNMMYGAELFELFSMLVTATLCFSFKRVLKKLGCLKNIDNSQFLLRNKRTYIFVTVSVLF